MYECRTKSCSQKPLKAVHAHGAAVAYFENIGFDRAGTLEVLRAGATRRVRQAEDLLSAAQTSRAKLDANHDRLQGERFAGELDNDDWQDWKAKYAAAWPVLDAQIAQFTKNLKRTKAEGEIAEVEEAVVERLSAIRAAASGVASAGDAQAMRAALLRLFTEFRLEPDAAAEISALFA